MTALEQYLGGLSDKRVGVIGAGVSNMPLIRMLRAAGVRVTVHDKKEPTELGDGYATLATLGVDFVLGPHYLDALDEDVIFRTPGVHPRFLEKARANGSEITSEMELFFAVCPCPIIGITGSDGKTTTTTLVSEILKHAGYTVHLGGNIGTPLLPRVDTMTENDLAVVELSSFQLMGMKHSPHIAAITNLTPNHLDYHKDFDEYVSAPFIRAMYRFNMQWSPREEIKGDYEVVATGSQSLIAKEVRAQQVPGIISLMANPLFASRIKEDELLKVTLEQTDLPAERILRTEKEAQEHQHQQMVMQALAQAEANVQALTAELGRQGLSPEQVQQQLMLALAQSQQQAAQAQSEQPMEGTAA